MDDWELVDDYKKKSTAPKFYIIDRYKPKEIIVEYKKMITEPKEVITELEKIAESKEIIIEPEKVAESKEVITEPEKVVEEEPKEVIDASEEVIDNADTIDETEADIILKAPLEIFKKNSINFENIIKTSPIKLNTSKIIRSSLGYIIFSEKFWLNASILALKYGDIDWRINCLCLSINAGIIIYKNRKIIRSLRSFL